MMFIFRVLILGLLGPSLTFAATKTTPPHFRIAILDLAPLGWSMNGKLQGAYVDLFTRVAKEANLKPEFILTSRPRGTEMALSGEVEATVMFLTPTKRYRSLKSIFMFNRETVILTRKEMTSLDLHKFKGPLAGLLGACPGIPKNIQLNVQSISNLEQGINLVEKKRVDGLCGSYLSVMYWLRKCHKDPESFHFHRTEGSEVHLIFGKHVTEKQIGIIQGALDKLKEDNTLEEIITKYTTEP